MREMVIGETFASRANSALLINRDSRIFLREFLPPIELFTQLSFSS